MNEKLNMLIEAIEQYDQGILFYKKRREQCITEVIAELYHTDDAKVRYAIDDWILAINTSPRYSLDKKKYVEMREEIKQHFADSVNPISEKISYEIDSEKLEKLSIEDKMILASIITKTPVKPRITLRRDIKSEVE